MMDKIKQLLWQITLGGFSILTGLPLAQAGEQAVICHTQILVTTPQTVSFYFGHVTKANFVGITSVGKWLQTYALCLDNQRIHALVWDADGKEHIYKSAKKYNNINNYITVLYPQDFLNAPNTQNNVSCQIHFFNNSAETISFYTEKTKASHELITLEPWQNQLAISACFENEAMIAQLQRKNAEGKIQGGRRYKSLTTYSDINTIAFVTFPNEFNHDPLVDSLSLSPETQQ